ncbi:hypothetical protein [Herpetosiphon geysericola]|uniref:Virion morphogenesis protein n=1 Tax=Herpetosiphon geysericola TaxID=70996 RepID=A0A0P6XWZ4_9CHLR|nr:hypothetical protein [Herpetosiphon geysericola]KPL80229.1 hypothetical protein SE18_24550 [Herpetosiphon geysericola]
MSYTINCNANDVAQWLRSDITPAFQAIGLGVTEAIRNEISPYPAQPAKPVDHWYERGYGQRWKRKDGSIGGRKTSQTLGRRWMIASRGRMVMVLMNTSTYSPFVHRAEDQTAAHANTGWVTDTEAISRVVDSPLIDGLVGTALGTILR